jgi:hypothetical protein
VVHWLLETDWLLPGVTGPIARIIRKPQARNSKLRLQAAFDPNDAVISISAMPIWRYGSMNVVA